MSIETSVVHNEPGTASKKRRPIQGKIGVTLLLFSVALSVGYPLFDHHLMWLLQTYASHDHHITLEGARQITDAFYVAVVLLFVVGFGLTLTRSKNGGARVIQALLGEPVCRNAVTRPSPRFVLIASSLAGLFLTIHIKLYDPSSAAFRILYKEDGIFESLTPVALMVSACLLACGVLRYGRRGKPCLGRCVTVALLAIAFGLFVNAGEEISWGQRVFGWGTPEALSGNIQNETNAHNYFNSSFSTVYRLPAVLPFLVLLPAWLEYKKRPATVSRLVFPHPSTIGLACMIAFVSLVWYQEEELLEELISVFALFYSLRVYGCLRAMRYLTMDDSLRLVAPTPPLRSQQATPSRRSH